MFIKHISIGLYQLKIYRIKRHNYIIWSILVIEIIMGYYFFSGII